MFQDCGDAYKYVAQKPKIARGKVCLFSVMKFCLISRSIISTICYLLFAVRSLPSARMLCCAFLFLK